MTFNRSCVYLYRRRMLMTFNRLCVYRYKRRMSMTFTRLCVYRYKRRMPMTFNRLFKRYTLNIVLLYSDKLKVELNLFHLGETSSMTGPNYGHIGMK